MNYSLMKKRNLNIINRSINHRNINHHLGTTIVTGFSSYLLSRQLSIGGIEGQLKEIEEFKRLCANYNYNPVTDTFSTYLDETGTWSEVSEQEISRMFLTGGGIRLSGMSSVKRALARRDVLRRKIDNNYYFPFVNGQTLIVTVTASNPFTYDDLLKSTYFIIRPTPEVSVEMKACYFEYKDLLSVKFFEMFESTLPRLKVTLAQPESALVINKLLTMKIGDNPESTSLLLDLFNKMCPVTSNYIYKMFSFYEKEDTTQRIQLFMLLLLLLTTTKSLSDAFNEAYSIQKPIMLTGVGQTGKSSILELFRMLSFNSSQAAEVNHLNNRFESFAWKSRPLLTFSDVKFHTLSRAGLSHVLTRIKQLSGNDPIRTEQKFKDIEDVKFYGLLLFTSNFPFPIDDTDFSAQYRRIVNLHLTNVIEHKDKILDYSEVMLRDEVLNFLILAIVLQSKMGELVRVIDSFSLVETLHNNEEHDYKLIHSPDPVRLVNFIFDRMRQRGAITAGEGRREGRKDVTIVHQAAAEYVNYLAKSRGFNVPISNLAAYLKQYEDAMDDNKPMAWRDFTHLVSTNADRGKLRSILKEAGLGQLLSRSPNFVPDLHNHPFVNFASHIAERVHGITTMNSTRRYNLPTTGLKSVKWMLNRFEKGEMVESIDVTSLVLIFENVSFSRTDIPPNEVTMDISDIQDNETTIPAGIAGLLNVDTDSVKLQQVPATSLSPDHNSDLLTSKQAELDLLLSIVNSLTVERKGIKDNKNRSSDDTTRLTQIGIELNRLRSRKKSFIKTIRRLNDLHKASTP